MLWVPNVENRFLQIELGLLSITELGFETQNDGIVILVRVFDSNCRFERFRNIQLVPKTSRHSFEISSIAIGIASTGFAFPRVYLGILNWSLGSQT